MKRDTLWLLVFAIGFFVISVIGFNKASEHDEVASYKKKYMDSLRIENIKLDIEIKKIKLKQNSLK
jgi:hypothetical protein